MPVFYGESKSLSAGCVILARRGEFDIGSCEIGSESAVFYSAENDPRLADALFVRAFVTAFLDVEAAEGEDDISLLVLFAEGELPPELLETEDAE